MIDLFIQRKKTLIYKLSNISPHPPPLASASPSSVGFLFSFTLKWVDGGDALNKAETDHRLASRRLVIVISNYGDMGRAAAS